MPSVNTTKMKYTKSFRNNNRLFALWSIKNILAIVMDVMLDFITNVMDVM